MFVQGRLTSGRVDVLPGSEHHVLGAILHVDEALVVDPADVTGPQPSVHDRLRGFLRFLPVAADEVWAFEPDLASLAGRDHPYLRIAHLYLEDRGGPSRA